MATRQRTCAVCHKLPKFCKCAPGAMATCPVCRGPLAEGEHFPQVDCYAQKAAKSGGKKV